MINVVKKYTEMNQEELALEYGRVKAEYDRYCSMGLSLDLSRLLLLRPL